MPKFSRGRAYGVNGKEDTFTSGHPHWYRPDFTLADLHKTVTKLPASSLTYHGSGGWNNALKIAKTGLYMSSEERSRFYGDLFEAGASSSEDQNVGSSAMVFARQQIPASASEFHVWYHPNVLRRTTNYSFSSDGFGKLANKVSNSYWDIEKASEHSGTGSQELMIKGSTSVLDDIAMIVFPNETQRAEAIAHYKKMGITEIHGLPIEEIFTTSRSGLTKVATHLWNEAIKAEKGVSHD